jgi:hypothetical protein
MAAETQLVGAPATDRIPLLLEHTAYATLWLIAFLAGPLFIALIWALRSGAPTHLRLASGRTQSSRRAFASIRARSLPGLCDWSRVPSPDSN